MMYVSLVDGRAIGVPIIWFPILHEAKTTQREQYEIDGGGVSLRWPALDIICHSFPLQRRPGKSFIKPVL